MSTIDHLPTTIVLTHVAILLSVHFIADFVLQSDWMAVNKSKNNIPLLVHCAIYTACFSWLGFKFSCVTFAAHFITDYITSRISSKLWTAGQRHWFFVIIGFDQLIHNYALLLCYLYFR